MVFAQAVLFKIKKIIVAIMFPNIMFMYLSLPIQSLNSTYVVSYTV